jgi:hypothetical protein
MDPVTMGALITAGGAVGASILGLLLDLEKKMAKVMQFLTDKAGAQFG